LYTCGAEKQRTEALTSLAQTPLAKEALAEYMKDKVLMEDARRALAEQQMNEFRLKMRSSSLDPDMHLRDPTSLQRGLRVLVENKSVTPEFAASFVSAQFPSIPICNNGSTVDEIAKEVQKYGAVLMEKARDLHLRCRWIRVNENGTQISKDDTSFVEFAGLQILSFPVPKDEHAMDCYHIDDLYRYVAAQVAPGESDWDKIWSAYSKSTSKGKLVHHPLVRDDPSYPKFMSATDVEHILKSKRSFDSLRHAHSRGLLVEPGQCKQFIELIERDQLRLGDDVKIESVGIMKRIYNYARNAIATLYETFTMGKILNKIICLIVTLTRLDKNMEENAWVIFKYFLSSIFTDTLIAITNGTVMGHMAKIMISAFPFIKRFLTIPEVVAAASVINPLDEKQKSAAQVDLAVIVVMKVSDHFIGSRRNTFAKLWNYIRFAIAGYSAYSMYGNWVSIASSIAVGNPASLAILATALSSTLICQIMTMIFEWGADEKDKDGVKDWRSIKWCNKFSTAANMFMGKYTSFASGIIGMVSSMVAQTSVCSFIP
jgi:hypothetical protein